MSKRRTLPQIEALEDRCLLSVVPLAELTEGNATAWRTFSSDNATATVSNDTTKVATGNQSLRFDTLSGFDTGIHLDSGADTWDVTSFKQLAFWTYSVNNTPIGFQGNQPVVVLQSATGSYRYTPTVDEMPEQGWTKHHIPLSGDAHWQRETIGTPDLANITAVEIHQDTWDYGFSVYYDGMQFSTRSVNDLPVAGPQAPAGITPGAVTPKVLLYVFDPIMENHGGQRLHQVYGWQDPVSLTQQSLSDLTTSSHGMYQPQVVQTVIADQQPYFQDGFQNTDQSFDINWANRDFHSSSSFDYARFIRENDLAARVDRGEIDEVWIYAPPIGGMYESVMAGKGAFWINGPTQAAGEHVFPIMGLNYERGVGEAIHSFGHRVEGTLDHAYEQLNSDPNNTWKRFTRLDKDAPGQGGVGNVHFPVNGTSDYDWGNTHSVTSNAADWYNYPNFTGQTQAINYTAWSPLMADTQREYLNWWYDHMPHVAGRTPDGQLNNWWQYIGDENTYKYQPSFYGTDGTGKVSINGLSDGASVSGTVKLQGDTLIDGVAGRVDLYIDGVYQSSDTIAPFTFSWNTQGLAAGSHSVQLRAYEVQNQTESVSSIIHVTVNGGITNNNHAPVIGKPSVVLTTQKEDLVSTLGTSVLDLSKAAMVSDADANAKSGIAITSAPNTGGIWQYTTDGGSSWVSLEGVSDTHARLLAVNGTLTRVRFKPNSNFNGSVAFTFRAWDQTDGLAGGLGDAGIHGGNSAFSDLFATAQMTIQAINDAPMLLRTTFSINPINEDDTANQGSAISSLANSLIINDVDANGFYGIAITSAPATGGTWQYSLNSGVSWKSVGTRSDQSALLLKADETTRLRFVPNHDYAGQALLRYRAWDRTTGIQGSTANTKTNGGSTAFSTATVSASLNVLPVNDAPKLTLGSKAIKVKRNGSIAFTGNQEIRFSDVDAGSGIVRVTLTVPEENGPGTLSISSSNGLTSLSGNKSSTMILEGSISAINTALRRVSFKAKTGFTGITELLVTADDRGLVGLGGILTTSATIRLTIA